MSQSIPVLLQKKRDNNDVCCATCQHRCVIAPGNVGRCGVRKNEDGVLYFTNYGNVITSSDDPIEKKPLYHFLPGTSTYSVAIPGCNFTCDFCQNWQLSQPRESGLPETEKYISPEEIVEEALRAGVRSIAYTYTEPTIFLEYAIDCAVRAREAGLKNLWVTNGYLTPEAIELVTPTLDAANIDLKAFTDYFYQQLCGAWLEPVKETIKNLYKAGVWVEVTTLLIPNKNDSEKELILLAEFLASVSTDIPWHLSRFHEAYRYRGEATSMESLVRAFDIGKRAGLKYVYLGNVPGDSNTSCPECDNLLIARELYATKTIGLSSEGHCLSCHRPFDGRPF